MEASIQSPSDGVDASTSRPPPVVFEDREAALKVVPGARAMFDDGSATFSQAFRAYYAKNPAKSDDPTENTIESQALAYLNPDIWGLFEKEYGRARDEYWCSEIRAAAVFTVKQPKFGLGASFHAVTNWRSEDHSFVEQAIALDELELATRFLPDGTTRTRSVKLVYDAYSSVLAAMDHAPGVPLPHADAELRLVKEQVQLARKFFRSAGERYAQGEYLRGMIMGALPLMALCSVSATFLWLTSVPASSAAARMIAWLAAGAVGAMLSVLVRISREDFKLNWEASKEELRTGGAIRPIVGGVLGAAVPMVIIAGIAAVTAELSTADDTKSRFSDFGLALAAGFSERWAPDLIGKQPSVLASAHPDAN